MAWNWILLPPKIKPSIIFQQSWCHQESAGLSRFYSSQWIIFNNKEYSFNPSKSVNNVSYLSLFSEGSRIFWSVGCYVWCTEWFRWVILHWNPTQLAFHHSNMLHWSRHSICSNLLIMLQSASNVFFFFFTPNVQTFHNGFGFEKKKISSLSDHWIGCVHITVHSW